MQMITNTANVTDFSGAMPIITYSNAVVTLIRQEPTSQIYIPSKVQLPLSFHCSKFLRLSLHAVLRDVLSRGVQ